MTGAADIVAGADTRPNLIVTLREIQAAVATAEGAQGKGLALRNGGERLAPYHQLGAAERGDLQDELLKIAENNGLLAELGESATFDLIHAGLDRRPPQANGQAHAIKAEPTIKAQLDPPPTLSFFAAASLGGQAVPPRRWLIPHRIPRPNVTMLNGDGAAGKTTIALQLAAATVRGTDWLGSVVDTPGPAIFFTAEEDRDEVHRRLNDIAEHHGVELGELDGLHLLCRPGDDCVLGAPDKSGSIHPTKLFESFADSAARIRPALIAIEAAADVFAGNENDRSQVRQFIGLLRWLAIASDAAVLLIAHPSLSGLASGSGTSGSTAWSNSARSRLYFTSAKDRADKEPDADVRELRVMKSNYGPAGEVVRLRWQRGVFVPESSADPLARAASEADVERAYLDCLDAATAQGRRAFPVKGKGWAPSMFAKMPQARGHRLGALADAQERLFGAGKIQETPTGPPSRTVRIITRTAS